MAQKNNIKEELENYKSVIEKELSIFFKRKTLEAKKFNSTEIIEIIENIREFTLRGGKRLRPILMINSFRCFKKPDKKIIRASICLELLQSFFLIHDDIMDNDLLRRGKPTMHKIYSDKNISLNYKEEFGKNMAIIAGDVSFALALESLSESNINKNILIRAEKELTNMITKVCYGQALDITNTLSEKISVAEINKIQHLKTAVYTTEGPIILGAILGGANKHELKSLKDYASPLGIAFQIKDDILGMFGDEKEIGKPIGSDIREGKKTLLVLKALEFGNANQRRLIKRLLGKKKLTNKNIKDFRKVIIDTGSLNYSEKRFSGLIRKSRESLEKQKLKTEGKGFLREITRILEERKK